METELEIGAAGALFVALAFVATIDMAFSQLSDVGLRRLTAERDERPGPTIIFLGEILENRPRFRFTLNAAIQVLLVAVVVLVTSISYQLFGAERRFLLFAFFIALALTLFFRQFVPRLLSSGNPERTLLTLLPLYRPFYGVLSLAVTPRQIVAERARRGGGAEHPTQTGAESHDDEADGGGDIQALIDVGEDEGILEEEEGELIQNIIEFGETRAGEVMTPRTEIVALPLTATVREARDVMVDSKYSRLPVYREQIEDVVGIIYVRDLLTYWAESREGEGIEALLRPAYFVPETKSVDELLEDMQKVHVQLALVIDEYGGLAGLLTVEDILEEIVGEIEDEDIESEDIVEIVESDDGYYDVLGSTEVGKIERLFDLEIEDDDFTTIAGLVINESGRVPQPGTQLNFRGLDVEVLEADERRINRLRLRRTQENKETAAAE
ncbi:MAG: magnesium and cobalt exporter, family [Acidobacteriota bacterium]|jgi:CBS domain containing-hemolysin-like protein|nr:magnesium and cobalt exporter, family [Acidobacteriota bacterium]